MAQIHGKQIKAGSITTAQLDPSISLGSATTQNKGMAAEVTVNNGDLACATAIAATPSGDAYVEVRVNGIGVEVGDGDKTHDCYFSKDEGATASAIADISAETGSGSGSSADKLYWNGSVAGFQLDADDVVDFLYES